MIYYIINSADLTQDVMEASVQYNYYTTRSSIPDGGGAYDVILKFEDRDAPVSLILAGYAGKTADEVRAEIEADPAKWG